MHDVKYATLQVCGCGKNEKTHLNLMTTQQIVQLNKTLTLEPPVLGKK